MQTVVKHEALAVRRDRERILAGPASRESVGESWVELVPSGADGPADRAERSDAVARSREALQALKPQELRALTLLAQGYSYVEISEITGYSHTKINRCLAEGRERFRNLLARSEDGRRCVELRPLLSAFCDGEAGPGEAVALREHLRACGSCRATLRAYRAAAPAAAALAPALPVARPLLERLHEAFAGISARLGGASDSALSQAAASGGARGTGMAALAKALAICVGTAGGAVACVATGVVPAPAVIGQGPAKAPAIERRLDPTLATEPGGASGVDYEPAPEPPAAEPAADPVHRDPEPAPASTASPIAAAPSGAVEYVPPVPVPAASPEPEPEPSGSPASTSGSPAGEFGP
jgi:hypothetical protein